MLKKFLAAIGVGGAKIDLILDHHIITMGQGVNGRIVLQGGSASQDIDGLDVELKLSSSYSKDDTHIPVEETISKIVVSKQRITVEPGEVLEYPFTFECPERLPVSSVNTRYYFQTNLDIDQALDAKDRDFVDIHPSGILHHFLAGFDRLGMIPHSEGYTGRYGEQIIQFRATQWLQGEFDEIVFSYQPSEARNRISGWFELDKANRGLTGLIADGLDLDEKKGRYSFSEAELSSEEQSAETIRQFIIEHSQGLISG